MAFRTRPNAIVHPTPRKRRLKGSVLSAALTWTAAFLGIFAVLLIGTHLVTGIVLLAVAFLALAWDGPRD